MARVTEDEVRGALDAVIEPSSGQSVLALDMVQGLVVKDGNVGFVLEVPADRGQVMEPLRQKAEDAVKALSGVLSVTAVMTAHKPAGSDAPAAPQRPATNQGEKPGVDGIPGVGPGRRRRLLRHFGSLKRVRTASPEQLCEVDGISDSLAASIHAALRAGDEATSSASVEVGSDTEGEGSSAR